jgi:hypothetical protein
MTTGMIEAVSWPLRLFSLGPRRSSAGRDQVLTWRRNADKLSFSSKYRWNR